MIQKLLGRSLAPFVRANDIDPRVGQANDWYAAYSSVIGSMDYYHSVSFPFIIPSHPLYFSTLTDPIQVGYINADITAEGKGSHLWPAGLFDPEWCPCPNGENEYPEWDGWPVLNPALPDYPVYSSDHIPVFYRGMVVKVTSLTSLGGIPGDEVYPYTKWFRISVPRAFAESNRTANADIWAFRFAGADDTDGWHPTGQVFPVQVEPHPTADELYIRVGRATSYQEGINEPPEPVFYMIYWSSPDTLTDTPVSGPGFSSGDEISTFLNLTEYTERDLFDRNRYDLVSYATGGFHYIKHTRSTRYDLVDGSPDHYGDPNPLIYRLPGLAGSLDPAYDPTSQEPGGGYARIGSIWGYGYSMDMGVDNPADRDCVVPAIICFQPSAGEQTALEVIRGPIVPPEFQPGRWEDFTYYPPTPDGYELFARIIIAQMGTERDASYRPPTYVAYIEYVPSYGRSPIPNADFRVAMIPLFTGHGTFSLNILSATEQGLLAILLVTPYTADKLGGLLGSVTAHMNDREVLIVNSYWRMPFQHPEHVSTSQVTTNMTNYILQSPSGFASMLEFDRYLRDSIAQTYGYQLPAKLASFNGDTNSSNDGLIIHDDKRLLLPKPIEIFFPADATCLYHGTPSKLNRDYSLRMTFLNDTADTVQKDLFISASRYWITDAEAAERLSNGLPRDPYLWPSKLDAIYQWQLYGRTAYLPDSRGGEVHTVTMRPFKAKDPNLPTFEEFVADLNDRYADQLASTNPIVVRNARESIADAISDQEYQYGGFATVDERTLSDSFVAIQSMTMGVTLFTTTGTATWKASSRMWAGDHPTIDLFNNDGTPKKRYGYTVGGEWQYQNFDISLVEENRRVYINEHPQDDDILKRQTNADGTTHASFCLDGETVLLSTSFTADFVPVCAQVASIKVQLRRVGIPKAKFIVTLNSTDPTTKVPTTVLQESGEFDSESLTEDFVSTTFTFTRPAVLAANARYAISIVLTDPTGTDTFLDTDNRIEWAFADRDLHSYGITQTSSILLPSPVEPTFVWPAGSSSLTVVDGSVFPSSSFYIMVDGEVLQVTLRQGNILNLATATVDIHVAAARVYEVTHVASDTEVRWTMQATDHGTYSWRAPTNPSYDATYELDRLVIDVGLVQDVLPAEWAGSDIRVIDVDNDAFYIAPSGQSYDADFVDNSMYLYGYAAGLTPLAGFNVANTYDFPPMCDLRVHSTNMTDGYICWKSTRLDDPSTLTIYPLARITSHVINYMPTATDMYITAVCRRVDGTTITIEKFLPAGTAAPVLLDAEEFLGIDMLWVNADAFAEEPYGASEHFEIRSK